MQGFFVFPSYVQRDWIIISNQKDLFLGSEGQPEEFEECKMKSFYRPPA